MKIRPLEVQKQFSGLELNLEETLVARQKWRNKYFSKETGLRSTHGCRYCKRRSEFEWTVLFADFPEPGPRDTLPHASKIALPFGKLPFLAFTEECDGPAWLLQKHDIEWLTAQEAVLVDLYITPYHKLNWTLIFTHEEWIGPHLVHPKQVQQ
jgi:hypothetical protein